MDLKISQIYRCMNTFFSARTQSFALNSKSPLQTGEWWPRKTFLKDICDAAIYIKFKNIDIVMGCNFKY